MGNAMAEIKKTESAKISFFPGLEFEREAGGPSRRVAGVDEVGRGCLAGPVVAAAVILPGNAYEVDLRPAWLNEVRDSKLLSPATRERLDQEIRNYAESFAIAEASVAEIDSINILQASHLAMGRAVSGLQVSPDFVWVDGNRVPNRGELTVTARPLVKGDQKSLSIACASIIAKVYRDRLMEALENQFPGYGLAIHKGYGTPAHQAALQKLGVAEFHRKSFAPVKNLLT